MAATVLPFSARADLPGTHPLAAYLLQLIACKRTNLCVSADVHSTTALLRLAEEVGDYICILKTHADIIDDFGERTIQGLKDVSRRKRFLLFEDRKFGDIGSTVQSQYARGPLRIADWAHLVNAHIFPGPAIVAALEAAAASALHSLRQSVSTEISVGTPFASPDGSDDEEEGYRSRPDSQSGRKRSVVATTTIYQTVELSQLRPSVGRKRLANARNPTTGRAEEVEALAEPPMARGLLLLAEMSSAGNLMTGEYTRRCVQAAKSHRDFVLGFISQRTLNEDEQDNFLSLTPGVKLPPNDDEDGRGSKGDGLGQQYRTPETVIKDEGCDIIIVGRGIVGAQDRAKEAQRYRDEAWSAYASRVGSRR